MNTFSIKLNLLKTILNDNFGKIKIDKFSCTRARRTAICAMDITIKIFTSTAVYHFGQEHSLYQRLHF